MNATTSTWWGGIERLPKPRNGDAAVFRTIAALYDDTIDTELTLTDIRKSSLAPEQISVILREHVLQDDRIVSSDTELSRVVAATAIASVSTWLRGLATLVMSDRAAWLVAGPIGYLLATVSTSRPNTTTRTGSETAAEIDLANQHLLRALRHLGFGEDEAGYIESRIAAGSPFIAVSAAEAEPLRTAHRIFGKRAAVYLGLARTDPEIGTIIQHLGEMGPIPRSESVLVADTASNLVRSGDLKAVPASFRDMRGAMILTQDERPFGVVRDALFSRPRNDSNDDVSSRYLIVQRTRFRGLQRWLVAIPTSAAKDRDGALHLDLPYEELRHLPPFVMSRPMSRREEQELHAFFRT